MKSAAPFRIWTTSDREAVAPKTWIVDGLLGAGEVSGLVAPPTAGKSAIALDLAATIAAGADWFGRRTAQGGALYFAAERSGPTKRRLRAFEVYHELSRINVAVCAERIDLLRNADDVDRVLATVEACQQQWGDPVRFIAIDTVRSAMPGGDENSGKDMGNLARYVSSIRDGAPGAHVQLIHHTPKGRPAEASGHTALTAMLDVVIVVTARGDRRSWRVVEANDLPSLPPAMPFTLRSVTIGNDGMAPVVEPAAGAVPEGATAAKPVKLPPDATTALDVLKRLANGAGHAIAVESWRSATMEEFGPRASGAKRQAWNKSVERLVGNGCITMDGGSVSVSAPSA